LAGEIRAETTEVSVERWSAQSAEQALMTVAGELQQKRCGSGVRLIAGLDLASLAYGPLIAR
jgi:hypothetical protein